MAGAGAAQEPSILDAGATRITLDDALARAVVRSPQLAQSEQALVNAGETRRTAVGAFLPTISTNSGMSVRSTQRFDAATDRLVTGSSNSYNAGLTARYDLFRGGQRFSELDRAAADLTAARARREDQRFNVNFQTKNFFFQALRQEELLTVALRRIEQATQSLEMTRTQQQVGAGTVSDTLRERLACINSRPAVRNAQGQSRAARLAPTRPCSGRGPLYRTEPRAPLDSTATSPPSQSYRVGWTATLPASAGQPSSATIKEQNHSTHSPRRPSKRRSMPYAPV